MDMCYDGTLVLPSSYAVMDEEEMSYLEGGGTAVVYGTASQIRSRLTAIIGASLVGTGASAALGFFAWKCWRCNYINNIRRWMVWFISILCFKSA